MKLKVVVILLFFFISSSFTSGEELVYYTSYDDNNGKLCRGIHVGDQYYYEEYSGGQDLYKNGTIYSINSEPQIFHIEVTLIPDNSL